MVVFQTMLKKSLIGALNNKYEDCENKHPLIRVLESVCFDFTSMFTDLASMFSILVKVSILFQI